MKNILLIGVGRFGRHIAVQLSQFGHQVMAVDTNEERINDVLAWLLHVPQGTVLSRVAALILCGAVMAAIGRFERDHAGVSPFFIAGSLSSWHFFRSRDLPRIRAMIRRTITCCRRFPDLWTTFIIM